MEINLKNKTPDIRFLNDIKEVVYDKEWLKTAPNLELYYMYRGLEEKEGLRYDITVIPARMLGKEFVKTKGHEHAGKYQEVYIVLEGKAIYLMQKRTRLRSAIDETTARQDNNEIEDVYAVKAEKNDVVVIPSYYGHVTINPSDKELKMANWISQECKSDYQPFLKKQGACYYYTKEGWIKNNKYNKVPDLRFEQPLKELPHNLDFLI